MVMSFIRELKVLMTDIITQGDL